MTYYYVVSYSASSGSHMLYFTIFKYKNKKTNTLTWPVKCHECDWFQLSRWGGGETSVRWANCVCAVFKSQRPQTFLTLLFKKETERNLSQHAWDVFHEIRFKEVAHVFFFFCPGAISHAATGLSHIPKGFWDKVLLWQTLHAIFFSYLTTPEEVSR